MKVFQLALLQAILIPAADAFAPKAPWGSSAVACEVMQVRPNFTFLRQAASDTSTTVTVAMIKELREATGAGMMDCKKALIETDGDVDTALDNLRKAGLAKADKKASRIAAEGKIIAATSGNNAVVVEINCETDFVAKDSGFLGYAQKVADAAAASGTNSVEDLMATEVDGETLEETRQALVSKIGENIQVRRIAASGGEGTTTGSYVHMGNIGVIVELEGGDAALAQDIAMHVAAMNPMFATQDEVPAEDIEKERTILTAQVVDSGKKPEIIEKMVEGRIRKYLQEICLVSQTFVKTNDKTVGELLKQNGAKMIGFKRIVVGEGIEKKVDDFAAEVASMAAPKAAEAPVEEEKKAEEPIAEVKEEPVAEVKEAAASTVTVSMIKELREATGAGMMDCKKALIATEGDVATALDNLRKAGLAKADKKASRIAAEGKIIAATSGGNAVVVEINCETDFVAKDAGFLAYAQKVADAAAVSGTESVEDLMAIEVDGETLEETRQALVSKIGENVQVRRVAASGGEGITTGTYVHMGSIGVIVELEGGDAELATDVAMHVAAMNPMHATQDDVPAEDIAKERAILTAQVEDSGKPPEIIEKMVEGRIRKYLAEICLVTQTFVKTNDKTVGELLKQKGATMKGFKRIVVGEGIEKKADDFAAEVAAMAGGK
jgi:elongation factor Ts